MKSKKFLRNSSISLSIAFAIIGLVVSFSPLYVFGYYPAGLAIIFSVLAYFISKRNNFFTKIPVVLIILSILLAGWLTFRLFTQEHEISNDAIIEEVVNKETEETVDDLEDALENLD